LIATIVERALAFASSDAASRSHAERSAAWVSALAEQLRVYSESCAPKGPVVSFCRGYDGNRSEFRTNELLFDVLVAETTTVPSVKRKTRRLHALSKALWVVESELKRTDSRDVLIDLNKMVVAKSANKLLVVSGSTRLVEWSMERMAELLDPFESNVFLATIPHPALWSRPDTPKSEVYQLSTGARWLTPPSSRQPPAAAHVEPHAYSSHGEEITHDTDQER
jgi:hypothetical protein